MKLSPYKELKIIFCFRPHFLFIIGAFLASCSSYRQNIMFKDAESHAVQTAVQQAEKNYVIQKNDYLTMEVYSNKGERIIDPDFKLTQVSENGNSAARPEARYLVDVTGTVKLPMVGDLKVEGLTIREVEGILQKEYAKLYTDPFIVVKYQNKRVVVLGAPGGQVIPLENENTPLVEILAVTKGIDNNAKAHNIRILRKDQVFVADFTTIDGYRKGNMIMEPGDVVYIEPIRRPLIEVVRDYGPFISIATTLTTLVVVITSK